MASVASPCVKLCALDPDRRWCLGCGRTLDEIGGWSALDDDGRRQVCDAAAARLVTTRAALDTEGR